ncbi:LRR receptor-like serine/threonine-protein kinase [Pyrus ussuriensis x Pyrus communis]|uniref:non-specific serine/threonine protein kinase n=1 Tax=Pyrus ussuriensis x Pyrus communis TaxID=2448454 RepID=A0A5N5HWG5_9ROSA|nr:LRR receptor-like serine/threonine-protein kinase [Pyrus ussuriensis x Pyrus communis]
MEHSRTIRNLVLLKFLHGFFLLVLCMMSTFPESAAFPSSTLLGNESDRLALLDFKKRITEDPLSVMSSWNHSIHFCSWVGITCHRATQRVLILDLQDKQLVGSIPPSIGNLTRLIEISLGINKFHGEIPQELGRLRTLESLNLSFNSFGGKLPTNMSHCTQLRFLDLFSNKIIGSIPRQLSSWLSLTILKLARNNLSGTIPGWIGNFSSLRSLRLGGNNFQGSIPNELGHITTLQIFLVGENNLSGMLPSSIYNISSIYVFGVFMNQFHGELPPNLGILLPNLKEFYCDINNFTGNIPVSLSNASRLQVIDFATNDFTGTVPGEILSLSINRFGGEIPRSIANLSTQLKTIYLGGNLLHGSLPNGIGNLINLTVLLMSNNYLAGVVPEEIGKLEKIGQLYLHDNKFSGPIPSSLGNMTSLLELSMEKNNFQGSIPPSLGNCQNLLLLSLYNNNLTGSIPQKLMELSTLSISLDLSENYLTGPLPSNVGDLVHLTRLNVSNNKLSGEIPSTISSCTSLGGLYLDDNKFEGTIPHLEELDISSNNLSGQIPEFLGKLGALKYLNLSYNDFEGELPKEGIFSNVSSASVLGNHRLCGGIPQLHLPACHKNKHHSSGGPFPPKVVIPISCALAFIIALSCFFSARSMLKKSRDGLVTSCSYKDWKLGVSYSQLVESTNGLSVDNLIGSGSFGSVYKGVIPSDGTVVAVKVLNLQQQGASKSFNDECKALRSVRHRNLVKIITSCSSIDNHGRDFKSLVFEFMPNGSLDSWLHPRDEDQSPSKRLNFMQRLNIAIDVAYALDYLHNHCETSIVHCDLKPSNVLLDEDMVAHVGDFGLARFLLEASNDPSLSQTIYGILLLEMFTGKTPTDDMFIEGLSIYKFVAMALPDLVMDVVDPSLLLDLEADGSVKECLFAVMQIGLSCCAISPKERMLLNMVVGKMSAIKDSYLKVQEG